jgi:hypothetical protein
MKRVTGDDLSRLIQKNGVVYLSNSDVFVENNRVVSELYFARSRKYLIDTTDMSRFVAKEVTVIYLSFTNVRISNHIAWRQRVVKIRHKRKIRPQVITDPLCREFMPGRLLTATHERVSGHQLSDGRPNPCTV